MPSQSQYDLTVLSNTRITPHLRRVLLTGDALAAFPRGQESGYVKVVFPTASGESVRRSYTIRAFDAEGRILTLDFVDHGDLGPASRWAGRARAGDPVTLSGPGEKQLVDPAADWFLIAGDLSALPAMSVNIEQLPADATGYVVVSVPDGRDRQAIATPPGIQLTWVVDADPQRPNARLVETVRALPWLAGVPYPWFAGEFDGMRAMRRYLRGERGLGKQAMYLSCYWKYGDTDEGMKRAKRQDQAAVDQLEQSGRL